MSRADQTAARRHAPDVMAMRRALDLAVRHRPHPNPRVGAVVLDPTGRELAAAAHMAAGGPHAEAAALAAAGDAARGGTVVVTLEPCVHHGRTPPCTDALIAAGVARVVIGAADPDERVAGRGADALRAAGIEVTAGVLSDEVEATDPGYFHHRRTGRPLVTLKLAMTLDGQAAAADGTSQWITSPQARRDAHRLRAEADAVVVGARTVVVDDPALTVRLADFAGPQPRPVVVAGTRPLPATAAVLGRDPIVFTPRPIADRPDAVVLPGPGGVDLDAMVKYLGATGALAILVEGGPVLASALLRAGVVDRIVVYVASLVGGGVGRPVVGGVFGTLSDAAPVEITSLERIGPDLKIIAVPTGEV